MPLKSCVCVCACSRVPEAEAKASESHVQLCSRQPRWADLLRGRGDRGGRRGGPGVVGQYLSRWRLGVQVLLCILDVCTVFRFEILNILWWMSAFFVTLINHELIPSSSFSECCCFCFLCGAPCVNADQLQLVFCEPPLQIWPYLVSLTLCPSMDPEFPPRTPLPCFLSVLCPATLSLFLCLRYQITAQSCGCTNWSIIHYKVCFLWKYSRKPA